MRQLDERVLDEARGAVELEMSRRGSKEWFDTNREDKNPRIRENAVTGSQYEICKKMT